MNKKISELKRTAIICAGIFAVSLPSMARGDWTIQKILNPLQPNTLGIGATAINDSGQVAGNLVTGFIAERGFIYSNIIGIRGLSTLGGTTTWASAINNAGQIAGFSDTPGSIVHHAFVTGPNGVGITDLAEIDGATNEATAINNAGQVVGNYYYYTSSGGNAFVTGPNGVGIFHLGTLGGAGSLAYGINDYGQVVGASSLPGNTAGHAFVTGENGVGMKDLGTLGGAFSLAADINNLGQVAGSSNFAVRNSDQHAFITDANGVGMTDLGTLGGKQSHAIAINDSGQVVGSSNFSINNNSLEHPFLYSNGVMTDLSQLPEVRAAGLTELQVTGINNNGQIVGYGTEDRVQMAVILSPYGSSSTNPIMPIANLPLGWQFEFAPSYGGTVFIDPQVATGYDYILDSGPNFTSVLLPGVGDGQFGLYLWNGTEWAFDSTLSAGTEHSFGALGVDRFRIVGIETSAGLDPNSPAVFVTGLKFADAGHTNMHMIPITQQVGVVPEPKAYAMLLAGLGLLGFMVRRQKAA